MKFLTAFTLILLIPLFPFFGVKAQQVPEGLLNSNSYIRLPDSAVNNPSPSPDINASVDHSEEILTLQNEYFTLLEQYRNQEQTYQIARAQYLQLNTLASQELAVKETRQLLSIRADIFLTYIQLIQLTLDQTKGVPLENKKSQLVTLTLLQEQVKVHKNSVLKVSDRINLDKESTNFDSIIELIKQQSYYSLSLIRLGTLQASYDKLLVVRNAVEKEIQERDLGVAVQAEKQRGLDEIDRTIALILSELEPLQKSVFIDKKINSVGQLSTLSNSISSPYSKIRQAAEFLHEIRK